MIKMLKRGVFDDKNLIIADRGYESYNMIAHMMRTNNVDFLIRVKQGKGAMAEIAKLPMETLDRDVSVTITTTQTNEDKRLGYRLIQTPRKKERDSPPKKNTSRWDYESPYAISFRVVRFMLDTGEYETVVTSLDRESFSIDMINDLYHMRWGIETSFRELKYAIGLVNIHTKKKN